MPAGEVRGHSAARSAGVAPGAACAGVPQRSGHCRTVVQVGRERFFPVLYSMHVTCFVAWPGQCAVHGLSICWGHPHKHGGVGLVGCQECADAK